MNEKELLMQNISTAMPVAQQMIQMDDEINRLEEEVEKKKRFGCGWAFLLLFSLLPIVMGIAFFTKDDFHPLAGLIAFAIGSIPYVLIILRVVRSSQCKARIKELERKCDALSNDPSLAWLPENYRTGSCIHAIIGYVQNGRVDSLKEAINLLEVEMHQQRVEAASGGYRP